MSLNDALRVLQDIEQLLHAHGISSVGPHQVRLTTFPASSSAVHTFNVQRQSLDWFRCQIGKILGRQLAFADCLDYASFGPRAMSSYRYFQTCGRWRLRPLRRCHGPGCRRRRRRPHAASAAWRLAQRRAWP